MAVQIQIRRDTAANWVTNDPVLAAGELARETDANVLKIGDGVTLYSALPNLLTGTAAFGEYVGVFDASIGTFPVAVNQGDWFNCTVAGTVDGQAFIIGDLLIALIDAPSTVTFTANWTIVQNISVTDHTLLTNIGTNTHAAIDTHIANVANPHVVTQAQVGLANVDNTSDANKPVSVAQAAADALHLLLDATNSPLTGPLTTQALLPDAVQTRDIGAAGNNFRHMFGGIGVFVKEAGAGASTIALPGNPDHGGLIAGTQGGSGPKVHRLEGGGFPAVAVIGNAAAQGLGTATIESTSGGATAIGSAYAYGATPATVQAVGFASTAIGYAYGSGTSLLRAGGSGAVAFGYANGRSIGSTAEIRADAGGAFAAGLSRQQSSTGTSRIRATQLGAFATGAIVSTSSGASDIQSTGQGSFAAGSISGATAAVGLISASGSGAFAQGRVVAGVGGSASITATASGAFAVGLAAGTDIIASAANAAQFGPGTNAEASSLQVGNGGVRLSGITDGVVTKQNGDIWVAASGHVFVHGNGVDVQIT
jgi:hypothetical protein